MFLEVQTNDFSYPTQLKELDLRETMVNQS